VGASVPVHVGRQGIYDASGTLQAYELLFRATTTAQTAAVGVDDADRATTSVILAAFADFDPEVLLGGRRGFVNLSRAFVVGGLPVPFAPDVAVLEVLESLRVDDELLAGLARLRAAGYRLALDDYVLTPETAPLLAFADYVKIDVLQTPWPEVVRTAEAASGAVLLAEKVEDAAMLERCVALGFELFQGYHLSRPETMTTRTVSHSHLAAVQLLAALGNPGIELRDVERLVAQDPSLTVRLLRVANSAGSSANRRITSLREAVVRVGLAQLRSWVVLLTMVDASGARNLEGVRSVMARARCCQQLAERVRGGQPETAFTLGLLHGVAGLLGVTGADLLSSIALEGPLAAGLRGDPTPEREVLDVVLGHERQELGAAARLGVDVGELSAVWLDALHWSYDSVRVAVAA